MTTFIACDLVLCTVPTIYFVTETEQVEMLVMRANDDTSVCHCPESGMVSSARGTSGVALEKLLVLYLVVGLGSAEVVNVLVSNAIEETSDGSTATLEARLEEAVSHWTIYWDDIQGIAEDCGTYPDECTRPRSFIWT